MNTIINGYDTEEAQKALAGLPERDRQTLHMIHQAEAEALNLVMSTRVNNVMEDAGLKTSETTSKPIEIAGVRLEASDLGAPTPEEIEKFGLIELKDGDKADSEVPQYGFHTISDYKEFKRAFPHYDHLSKKEAEAKNLFPYTYCAYNKLARNMVLKNRNKREPNDKEWKELMDYAKEKGNNALIQVMNAGFVGYRLASSREFCDVGDGAVFGVSDGSTDGEFMSWLTEGGFMPWVWFDRGGASVGRRSTGPGQLMVVRAVSENEA